MDDVFYRDCVCPACRVKLDEVQEGTYDCPGCGARLERARVWQTRRYPGIVELPHWVRAFGWPFLLMLSGVGLFFWGYWNGFVDLRMPSLMVAAGLIFFYVKFSGKDRGI
jgi:predicted RNA-binding Zn-ribbon protein involved in translation (DUF1610 family)